MTASVSSPVTAVLLLADARLPAGGHAHSGQLEAAAAADGGVGVGGVDELAAFLRGKLTRAGLVAAAVTAAACAHARSGGESECWQALDRETSARLPSPAQRAASRHQGRTLLRAAAAAWPSPSYDVLRRTAGGPHHPVILGAVAAAAGCSDRDAALVAAYLTVSGPASAAVRLLGLDPLAVNAALAGLAATVDHVADAAAVAAAGPLAELPCASTPVLDIRAEDHSTWEVRLFAS